MTPVSGGKPGEDTFWWERVGKRTGDITGSNANAKIHERAVEDYIPVCQGMTGNGKIPLKKNHQQANDIEG